MNERIVRNVGSVKAVASPSQGLVWGWSVISASTFTIVGLVLLGATFFSSAGIILKGIQAFLSLAVVASGGMLWRTILTREYRSQGVGLLAGEIALACEFMYLGLALPAFHQGLTSVGIASMQFSAILAGFVFGAGSLALSGISKPDRPLGQVAFPAMVRDGVTLLTGTILLAIALGQLPGPALKIPLWSWISFLGITIPGMLLLVGREGVKEYLETRRGLWYQLLVDGLLVLGLTIMLYGSYANLNLGMNGYQVGFKGNGAGLALWLIAVFLLLVVRGAFKLAYSHKYNKLSYRVLSKTFYVIALIPFIYGERSLISGKSPVFSAGGAAPIAALLLLGVLLVLVVSRPANQKVC